MNDDDLLDEKQREALKQVRKKFAETLPLLAAAEEALDIPDDERYVSRDWLGKAGGPN